MKKSLAAAFRKPLRPPHRLTRRTESSLIGLERRVLLSLRGLDSPVAESIRLEAVGGEIHSQEAAKVNRQVTFVDSL